MMGSVNYLGYAELRISSFLGLWAMTSKQLFTTVTGSGEPIQDKNPQLLVVFCSVLQILFQMSKVLLTAAQVTCMCLGVGEAYKCA